MRLEEITAGLIQLLNKNNYNPVTIQFYQREWTKIGSFLNETYGDTSFDIEKGLRYLEKQYGLKTRYNDGTLSQQRVQLLRVVNMLEDYRIYQVLTRRYYASHNPIQICKEHLEIYNGYLTYLKSGELSKCTVKHYECTATEFLDYLNQKDVYDLSGLNLELCNLYIHTFAGLSYKSVEQKICGLLNIPVILGPVFRIFKAVCPECQGRAKITSQFRHRSPAFRSCKATLMHVKPGLFYSKSGFAVYPGW